MVIGLVFGACVIQKAEAADVKIGYVDLAKVFDQYQWTVDADKDLEQRSGGKQTERDNKVDEIKGMREELELASKTAREEKQDVIDQKIKDLKEFDREVTTDLRKERDVHVREILKEINDAVQEYGKANGYTLIIHERVLLYGQETLDVSDDIIKILNERYQSKKK